VPRVTLLPLIIIWCMATGLSVVALLDAVERRFEKWRPHPR